MTTEMETKTKSITERMRLLDETDKIQGLSMGKLAIFLVMPAP